MLEPARRQGAFIHPKEVGRSHHVALRELPGAEAGELLGCSERQFRRYRWRWEQPADGLVNRRLGWTPGTRDLP